MNKYLVVVLVLLWGFANSQRSSGSRRRPSGNLFFSGGAPNRPARQFPQQTSNGNFPNRPPPFQPGRQNDNFPNRPPPFQPGRQTDNFPNRPSAFQPGRQTDNFPNRPPPFQPGRQNGNNFGFNNNNFGPALFPDGGEIRERPNRQNNFESDRGRGQGDQDRGDEWMFPNLGTWNNNNGNSNNNNNNNNFNSNNNGNNNNGNRGPTTTFRPTLQAPLAVVHNPPAGCSCQYPPTYNPVCGSDGQNYKNQALLECVNRCGTRVTMRRRGTC